MSERRPRSRGPAGLQDFFLARLGDGETADALAEELVGWLAESPRFRTFAEEHRAKIGKKLRSAANPDARRDVRTELAAARLLLADRRFALAFESHGAQAGGPDFVVRFRGERPFNLEVTRLRQAPGRSGYLGQLLAKLHQLPPGAPNAILVAIEGDDAGALDVEATMRSLRARADRKDEDYFVIRGFASARGFYHRYLRLGGVIVWCEAASGEARAALWVNGSARIALPGRAALACLACLRGD